MTCKQWYLFQVGQLTAVDFKAHAATCRTCQAYEQWDKALSTALTASAAPAQLVERVLAQTTRRKNWWMQWKMVLVGGLTVLLLALGIGIRLSQPTAFNHTELVAYMSQTTQDEYTTFSNDLNLLETF